MDIGRRDLKTFPVFLLTAQNWKTKQATALAAAKGCESLAFIKSSGQKSSLDDVIFTFPGSESGGSSTGKSWVQMLC